MTDDQLRSRLREALMEAWRNHPSDQPKDRFTSPTEVYFSVEKAVDALTPTWRDLLSTETQQIREELELLKGNYDRKVDECRDEFRRVTQAEAEAQALREALEKLTTEAEHVVEDTAGMFVLAHVHGMGYNGRAMDLKAPRALLQRLTPASPRTGEK